VVNLDRIVPDPPYPPVLIQSVGCGNNSTGPVTCSLPKPASAQSAVIAVYWVDTGNASVSDDVGDAFAALTPAVSKPNTGSAIYTYSTTTQGTQSVTVSPANAFATVPNLVILELSSAVLAGAASNSTTYPSSLPCNTWWACELSLTSFASVNPFSSASVPISNFSILIAAQLGIPAACQDESGNNPNFNAYMGPQMYLDPGTQCMGMGFGFAVLSSRNGNNTPFCGNNCGFTVEVRTASAPVVAPFFVSNQQSIPVGSSWAAEEVALQ
jgi:hypothetical protein